MNIEALTIKQKEAFYLLIQGKTNAEIGQVMHLSEKTVKAHVTDIFKKLKCKTRSQVIARHYIAQLEQPA